MARGDSFSLTCVAMGDQPVSISWEREGVLVGNGMMVGSDLVFGEALPDHAGVYECVARSGMVEDRAAATVTVSCEFLLLKTVLFHLNHDCKH